MNPLELGRVVCSRAGRDRGRYFLVIALAAEADRVWVADGALRTASRPKCKKMIHLHAEKGCAAGIREKLERGIPLTDAEIRNALAALGYPVHRPALGAAQVAALNGREMRTEEEA